jgi:hypothetical protein
MDRDDRNRSAFRNLFRKPPPPNDWYQLRVIGLLLPLIPLAVWMWQEAVYGKPTHDWLIYLVGLGFLLDLVFKIKNRRWPLFIFNRYKNKVR